MKKIWYGITAFLLVLALSIPAFASVGVDSGGSDLCTASDIDLPSALSGSCDGSKATFTAALLNTRKAAAKLTLASSSTAITDSSLPYSVIDKKVGGGGGLDSTGIGTTLPNGTAGQTLSIIITGLQSGGSWVVTPTTATGFSRITFDTKGDTATLLYVNDTIGWIVQANGGAVLTQA